MSVTRLDDSQRAAIDQCFNYVHDDSPRRTVWELIARKCERPLRDIVANLQTQMYGKRGEEILGLALYGQTAGDGLFAPDCFRGAITRRFVLDSPLELALRLSIAARYEWLQSQFSHNDEPEDLFVAILQAAAAHDFTLVDRLAMDAPDDIPQPNNKDKALIYSGLVGLWRNDDARLKQAAEATTNRKPSAYLKSVQQILRAASTGSADEFADGMKKLLRAYGRWMYNDEVYQLVDPHAIGLYQMCRRRNPELVANFDTSHKLPWDSDYLAWLETCGNITAHYDLSLVPREIHPHLVDLEPLGAWAAAFKGK